MDDLAPAPAQRTSDDGGRTPEQKFPAPRKGVKKVQPAPPHKRDSDPDQTAEPATDHQIDVLA